MFTISSHLSQYLGVGYWQLVAAFLATYVVYSVWIWNRLRHIPGPFLGSISTLWMLNEALKGNYNEVLKQVADQYGNFPSQNAIE